LLCGGERVTDGGCARHVPGEPRIGFEESGRDGAQAKCPVTVTLSARRDGAAIEAAGSLPVTFSDFRIAGPRGYGFLGSLASNGTAEFLLILRPQ
jgi:hypothetical protein